MTDKIDDLINDLDELQPTDKAPYFKIASDKVIELQNALKELKRQEETFDGIYEWRPEETAPKDGSAFLAFNANEREHSGLQLAYWSNYPDKCTAMEEYRQGKRKECGSFESHYQSHYRDVALSARFTHWMPLPSVDYPNPEPELEDGAWYWVDRTNGNVIERIVGINTGLSEEEINRMVESKVALIIQHGEDEGERDE